MRTVDSRSSLWVLKNAPTPAQILTMDEEALARGLGSTYRAKGGARTGPAPA